jgi:hypothetical protein
VSCCANVSPQTCRNPMIDHHCVISVVVCVIGVSFIGAGTAAQLQHKHSSASARHHTQIHPHTKLLCII